MALTIEDQKILATALKVYVDDPSKRCVRTEKESICKYSGESVPYDSPGCLIGQLLPKEFAKECDDKGIVSLLTIFALLKRNKGLVFHSFLNRNNFLVLKKFQNLHDFPYYWDKVTISRDGIICLINICDKFKLDYFIFKEILQVKVK